VTEAGARRGEIHSDRGNCWEISCHFSVRLGGKSDELLFLVEREDVSSASVEPWVDDDAGKSNTINMIWSGIAMAIQAVCIAIDDSAAC
jgi:hypothetical protein